MGDRQVFALLRALADVVLVGAATVRAENYGPAMASRRLPPAQAAEVSRTRSSSGTLDLPWK